MDIREAEVVIDENELVDTVSTRLDPNSLLVNNKVAVRVDNQEFSYGMRNIITHYNKLDAVILYHATWMDVEEPVGSYDFVFVRRIMVAGVATFTIKQRVAHIHAEYSVADCPDTSLELMRLLYTD